MRTKPAIDAIQHRQIAKISAPRSVNSALTYPQTHRDYYVGQSESVGEEQVDQAAQRVVNWICFVKLSRLTAGPVLSYIEVDVRHGWCRNVMATPLGLEAVELVQGSRHGPEQRGFMSPEICEGLREDFERPCHYD